MRGETGLEKTALLAYAAAQATGLIFAKLEIASRAELARLELVDPVGACPPPMRSGG